MYQVQDFYVPKNGDFESTTSSAVAYAWYVWQKGYKGNTIVKWIN